MPDTGSENQFTDWLRILSDLSKNHKNGFLYIWELQKKRPIFVSHPLSPESVGTIMESVVALSRILYGVGTPKSSQCECCSAIYSELPSSLKNCHWLKGNFLRCDSYPTPILHKGKSTAKACVKQKLQRVTQVPSRCDQPPSAPRVLH